MENNKAQLNYFSKDAANRKVFDFKVLNDAHFMADLVDKINYACEENTSNVGSVVYVFAANENKTIFITSDLEELSLILEESKSLIKESYIFWLYAYGSFEDAYREALRLREGQVLCYN